MVSTDGHMTPHPTFRGRSSRDTSMCFPDLLSTTWWWALFRVRNTIYGAAWRALIRVTHPNKIVACLSQFCFLCHIIQWLGGYITVFCDLHIQARMVVL